MKKIHYWGISTFLLSALSILFLIFWFPEHQAEITTFSAQYPYIAPIVVILFRVIGIVIPPIPGGIISIALLPVLGWFWSYVYAVIGILIGTTIAFFIARRFQEPIVRRFVSLQELRAWEDRLNNRTKFLAFLGIRLTTGPILDFISYVAGLTSMSFRDFFLATLIAEIPSLLWYFLGEQAYKQLAAQSSIVGVLLTILILVILYVFRNHELLKKK